MTEEWRPVVGFEGYYEVSNLGRVRRVGAAKGAVVGRILRQTAKKSGHLKVELCRDSRYTSANVHRLVLEAFVGPCPEGMEACHFPDRNPANNRLENLRWDTLKANRHDMLIHGTNFQANKTHCPRGHELVLPNLVNSEWAKKGARSCLACARAAARIYRLGGDLQAISDEYYERIMMPLAA